MPNALGAPAPAYVYTVSHAHCDGFNEAHVRLEAATAQLQVLATLLSDFSGDIVLSPRGLYELIANIERESSAALEELACAMTHKEAA